MNIALIVAGGSGTRIGGDIPKQFLEIESKPLIIYTIEVFQEDPQIDAIALICREDYREKLSGWIEKWKLTKVKWITAGGDTRQQSVENGLRLLDEYFSGDDILLIHDAARPLVSHRIISDSIKAAAEHGAVNTVVPSADTVIVSDDGLFIDEVTVRSKMYLCQTPQSFKLSVIKKAHEYAKTNRVNTATDDCQLVLAMGENVFLVKGDKLNFKVTTPEDLMILKALVGR